MTWTVLRGVVVGTGMLIAGIAAAAEPVLPAPRPVPIEVGWPISYVRPNPYDVWQYYDVDRTGRFRPVVAPLYGEVRYLATGEPYPWWQSRPQWVKPQIGNPATFGGAAERVLLVPPAPTWNRMPYADE